MYLNDHYNKKLKIADVIEIKRLLKEGSAKGKDIATMFNINPSTISEINTNKKWKLA